MFLRPVKTDNIGSHTREARDKVCKYENTTIMGVRQYMPLQNNVIAT